ncbi:MAG: glycosyltransferase family 39 protein [Chloroflexota bacterium]
MNSKSGIVVGILTLAFTLRIGVAFAFPDRLMRGDAAQYVQNATLLQEGAGYIDIRDHNEPELTVPPFYPFFLATTFSLFGSSLLVGRLVQAVLATVTCILVYWLATKEFGGATGLGTLLLFAFYPATLVWHGFYLTETLYTLFIVILFLTLFNFAQKPTRLHALLTGIVFGLTLLVREILLFFPAVFVLVLIASKTKWQHLLTLTSLFLLGTVIVLAPWLWRNYQATGAIVYTSRVAYLQHVITGTGYLSSRYKKAIGGQLEVTPEQEEFNRRFGSLSENLSPTFIIEHPRLFVQRMWNRFAEYWFHPNGLYGLPDSPIFRWPYRAGHVLLVLVAAVGGAYELYYRRRPLALAMLATLLCLTVLNLTTYGPNPRYNLPFLPFVFMFSASGLWHLWQQLRNGKPFIHRPSQVVR